MMRISRLFIQNKLTLGESLILDEESAHYLRTVLRLKPEMTLVLFNGLGGEYLARLQEVNRKIVSVLIEQRIDRSIESPLTVFLGLCVSRSDRMDFAIQKAVELGVNSITPLISARCNLHLKADKPSQKIAHWQKIAQHACEQSGRTCVPPLLPISQFPDWLPTQQGLKIFLDPTATTTLNQLQPQHQLITLLSGPEGGFTEVERDLAKEAGFIPVALGQRILRTETAALAALAAMQMLWGDFAMAKAL